MVTQKKCRELLEIHIEEGKELTKIFTGDLVVSQLYPLGIICLSTWMIDSLKIFNYIGVNRIDCKTYNVFEINLENMGRISLNTFEYLIDCLQDVLKTSELKEVSI